VRCNFTQLINVKEKNEHRVNFRVRKGGMSDFLDTGLKENIKNKERSHAKIPLAIKSSMGRL